jgi:DNA-binding NtrC family response regulator
MSESTVPTKDTESAAPTIPPGYARYHVPASGIDYYTALDAFERSIIHQAFLLTQGNKTAMASLLRLNRTTLVMKMKKLGMFHLNYREMTGNAG